MFEFPPHSYVEILMPNKMVLEGEAFGRKLGYGVEPHEWN